MLRKSIFVLSSVVLLHGIPALANDAAEPSRSIARESGDAANSDDEYNFSWLDPDKKVYVLQNRKYRKTNRFAIFGSGGLNLSNPYRTEYEFVPRVAYWFSEQWGAEIFFSVISNGDNENLRALKAMSNALPFVRENRSFYGAAVSFTPWYSKLNFFNKILYFDWLFLAGMGQTSTAVDQNTRADRVSDFKTENLFTFFYGTGLQFYLTRNFLMRLDLIGMMYNATGADNKSKTYVQNYEFTAGAGWAF